MMVIATHAARQIVADDELGYVPFRCHHSAAKIFWLLIQPEARGTDSMSQSLSPIRVTWTKETSIHSTI
jgi:hypothetical protein